MEEEASGELHAVFASFISVSLVFIMTHFSSIFLAKVASVPGGHSSNFQNAKVVVKASPELT